MNISNEIKKDFGFDENTDGLVVLMHIALSAATFSPDPSTQNSALLVNDFGERLCWAVNEFPGNVKTTKDRWTRPTKYNFIEHAERNVIYKAARSGICTDKLIMICPWFACSDCARAIVQAGIKEVIGINSIETNARWEESCKIGNIILDEAGVNRTYINFPIRHNGVQLRRDEKIIIV